MCSSSELSRTTYSVNVAWETGRRSRSTLHHVLHLQQFTECDHSSSCWPELWLNSKACVISPFFSSVTLIERVGFAYTQKGVCLCRTVRRHWPRGHSTTWLCTVNRELVPEADCTLHLKGQKLRDLISMLWCLSENTNTVNKVKVQTEDIRYTTWFYPACVSICKWNHANWAPKLGQVLFRSVGQQVWYAEIMKHVLLLFEGWCCCPCCSCLSVWDLSAFWIWSNYSWVPFALGLFLGEKYFMRVRFGYGSVLSPKCWICEDHDFATF